MNFIFAIGFLGILFECQIASAQENAQSKVSDALLECYNNTYALLKENRLPHNIHAFIAIIRKIEDNPQVNMDLRQLSVTLLHRFRQDGIVINAEAVPQEGVTPYATEGFQFYRHAEMLKLIPGNAIIFNNNSINIIERCTLHSMISSSIDTIERGDESSTCRLEYDQYRIKRSLQDITEPNTVTDDVETLTADEIKSMNNNRKNNKNHDNSDEADSGYFDPNSWYPPLPLNHPDNARLQMPTSKCPSESGVIKTDWGVVSGGALLAGIAAALEPQKIRIEQLMRRDWQDRDELTSNVDLDNKWIATLAGDLVEVALRQGPSKETNKIGTPGHWNSTHTPKYYFLNSDQGLEFTEAEVRGDLDGLILASNVASWYSTVPSLKLSQILDMYYSDRGVFNNTIRACNRRNLLTIVAPNDTTSAQTYLAAMVLNSNTKLPKGTLSLEKVKTFSVAAANELFKFIPTSMNNDKTCAETPAASNLFHRLNVDLTIVLDTTWPFRFIQPILQLLLEMSEINKYASNFTVINAWNGNTMINSSNSLLDFYVFNETNYALHIGGFDLPKSLDTLKNLQLKKLNHEHDAGIGGGRSDVILIVPYSSTSISDADKDYSLERIWKMREDTPDVNILFLTAGAKDRWSDFVRDVSNDIVSVGTGAYKETIGSIQEIVNRMKRIPKRLVNSQCGGTYSSAGQSSLFVDYLEPSGVQFYRLHPNYFYKTDDDNSPTVRVQGSSGLTLNICHSRNPLHINVSFTDATCRTVTSDTDTIAINCVGASYIHQCSPLYLSVAINETNGLNQCSDSKICRYPDMAKFTISYENLVCANNTNSTGLSAILILLATICTFLEQN